MHSSNTYLLEVEGPNIGLFISCHRCFHSVVTVTFTRWHHCLQSLNLFDRWRHCHSVTIRPLVINGKLPRSGLSCNLSYLPLDKAIIYVESVHDRHFSVQCTSTCTVYTFILFIDILNLCYVIRY